MENLFVNFGSRHQTLSLWAMGTMLVSVCIGAILASFGNLEEEFARIVFYQATVLSVALTGKGLDNAIERWREGKDKESKA